MKFALHGVRRERVELPESMTPSLQPGPLPLRFNDALFSFSETELYLEIEERFQGFFYISHYRQNEIIFSTRMPKAPAVDCQGGET